MLSRVHFLRVVHGADWQRWARRFDIEPFSQRCRCGHMQFTSIPFAVASIRGLIAPPCACGALPPFCAVSIAGSGSLAELFRR